MKRAAYCIFVSLGAAILGFGPSATAQVEVWNIEGDNLEAHYGTVLATGRDVNGDGYSDVASGSPLYDGVAGTKSGRVTVYSGRDGAPLHVFEGEFEGDEFGTAIAFIDDISGDAIADIAIGAPKFDGPAGNRSGKVYIFSGRTGNLTRVWFGEEGGGLGDAFGQSIADVGDLNNDNIPEIAVGAWRHNGSNGDGCGKVYLFSGASGFLVRSWEGEREWAGFGYTVACAGSVDGNSVPDLMVGAPFHEGPSGRLSGKVYLLSGTDGSELWSFDGDRTLGLLGLTITALGDVDGNGFDDVAAAAPDRDFDHLGLNVGKVFVLDGQTGTEIWSLGGDDQDIQFGTGLSATSDIDGDNLPDILIGAPGYWGPTGWGYGRVYGYSGDDGEEIFFLSGDHDKDEFGHTVGSIGFLDSDGLPEMAVGVRGYDTDVEDVGQVRLISMIDCYVAFEEFGSGLAGRGGFVPRLEGFPEVCDPPGLLVQVSEGLGGATGLLWLGFASQETPFFGGSFYIDFTTPWIALTITLSGPPGGAGVGTWAAPGKDVQELAGLTFYLQGTFVDVDAVEGISLTNPIALKIL